MVTRIIVDSSQSEKLHVVNLINKHYSGRNPGLAGGPVGCGHSKFACVCTGLPLTSVQFISVTEVVTKKHSAILCCTMF